MSKLLANKRGNSRARRQRKALLILRQEDHCPYCVLRLSAGGKLCVVRKRPLGAAGKTRIGNCQVCHEECAKRLEMLNTPQRFEIFRQARRERQILKRTSDPDVRKALYRTSQRILNGGKKKLDSGARKRLAAYYASREGR